MPANRKQDYKHEFSTGLNAGEQLPPRKARYGNQKKKQVRTLLTSGVVLFGTLFAGVFLYEMVQVKNTSETTVQTQEASGKGSGNAEVAGGETAAAGNGDGQAGKSASEQGAGKEGTATAEATKTTGTAGAAGTAASTGTATTNSPGTNPTATTGTTAKTNTTNNTAGTSASTTTTKPTSTTKPATTTATKTTTTAKTTTTKPKVTSVRHVVQKGDTLFRLSRKYYGNGMGVDRIARFNGLNVNGELPIGKVLYIPTSR
ncbi:LysM peptidoglycan-binding domain-containing protein [Brevibacillus dissolubilis]|uniref:LysM peptidoglycan-binding domain-containing protein n=1 Tax=Brevibacillus dissolubilis TaxID=1844116 RepID=UPI001116F0AA|nr:LysM peptidoglycan-binding domain-containing protein [Brevibacillus dissolubilis]